MITVERFIFFLMGESLMFSTYNERKKLCHTLMPLFQMTKYLDIVCNFYYLVGFYFKLFYFIHFLSV